MTTLDRLRSALKVLPPGAPVALQIQRDQKLLFLVFTLDQPRGKPEATRGVEFLGQVDAVQRAVSAP
jgi:S1-C subfamily serine protease